MSFVYLIRSGAFSKIGIAQDPTARLAQLQTGNPSQLVMSYCFEFDNSYAIEQVLHQKFSHKVVLREWFELSENDIGEFVSICNLLGGKKNDASKIASDSQISDQEIIAALRDEPPINIEWIKEMIRKGWRIETKTRNKKDGAQDRNWVVRGEEIKNGKHYRPVVYIGKFLPPEIRDFYNVFHSQEDDRV